LDDADGGRMYEGEKTLLVTRPTRLISLRFYVAAFLLLILAGVLFSQVIARFVASFPNPDIGSIRLSTILAGILGFFALLAFLVAELKRKSTRYIITDNKIIREDGILNKNTAMIPYTQLERVDMRQSFSQRILKIGTIVVDTGEDTMNMDMVPHPAHIQELLSSRIGRRGWTGPPPGTAPPPGTTR